MKTKHLTFDELMSLALEHYNDGGDSTFECWDRNTFDDYVKLFGPMTKTKALKMFKDDKAQMDDMLGWF